MKISTSVLIKYELRRKRFYAREKFPLENQSSMQTSNSVQFSKLKKKMYCVYLVTQYFFKTYMTTWKKTWVGMSPIIQGSNKTCLATPKKFTYIYHAVKPKSQYVQQNFLINVHKNDVLWLQVTIQVFTKKKSKIQKEVHVNLCQKLFFLQNIRRTCCVQKLFWMSETISVHNMFFPGMSLEFNEQSVVILWVSWCKNESFWQRFTCTYKVTWSCGQPKNLSRSTFKIA